MRFLRAVLRGLQSRRLAVGLIALVILYSVVATLVPQTSFTLGSGIQQWQASHPGLAPLTKMLGLHSAFSAPLFLAVMILLAASTAACAWERTRAMLRDLRTAGRVTDAEARRLKERPRITVPAPSSGADPLDAVAASLRPLRLKVRRGPLLLEASSGRAGALGSCVFHWSLALLFVLIALGRLSRAEGQLGVPVGFPRFDTKTTYRQVQSGPLYPGHSGLKLAVTDLRPFKDAEGVDRGISPYVELYDGPKLLRKQRVYPNNPLRYGSLLIHSSGYGLAAVLSVEDTAGAEILQSEQLLDFDKSPTGTGPVTFALTGADGKARDVVSLRIPLDRDGAKPLAVMPKKPRAEVNVRVGWIETATVLPEGASVKLPSGEILRLKDVVYYARLSVADDWSIYPIYLFFTIAAVAVSFSLLLPYRRVLVMRTGVADGSELHAVLRHRRGDWLFAEQVEAALREAAGQSPPEKEESA